jgi:hypothetical protein
VAVARNTARYISRESWLSSTSSTRRDSKLRCESWPLPGRAAPSPSSLGAATPGRRTVNVEPRPSPSLAACTVPPCISASRFTSVSPMPSPPRERSMVWCACTNRSKIRGSISAGMPTPESTTRTTASSPSRPTNTLTVRSPCENLSAFDSRLPTICSRRTASPCTQQGSDTRSMRPWLALPEAMVATDAFTLSARFTTVRLSTILPVTARPTSSRSSTSRAMCSTWRLMMPVARSAIGSECPMMPSACTAPWMAPSGLRSSCASIARNSSFERFSRCARASELMSLMISVRCSTSSSTMRDSVTWTSVASSPSSTSRVV